MFAKLSNCLHYLAGLFDRRCKRCVHNRAGWCMHWRAMRDGANLPARLVWDGCRRAGFAPRRSKSEKGATPED